MVTENGGGKMDMKKAVKFMKRVLIVCVVLGLWAFFIFEFRGLPPRSGTGSLRGRFEQRMDGAVEILKKYDVYIEKVEKEESEDGKAIDYDLWAILQNGERLYLSLSRYSWGYPSFYMSITDKPEAETVSECHPNLDEYPYFFELAANLSDNRFSQQQYRNYCIAIQDRVKKEEWEGSRLFAESELRSTLFELGKIEYSIDETEDMLEFDIFMSMYLY